MLKSLDAVTRADKPQEKKDSIVTRSLALLGLNTKVQADLDSYYLFAKTLDSLATAYSQMAGIPIKPSCSAVTGRGVTPNICLEVRIHG